MAKIKIEVTRGTHSVKDAEGQFKAYSKGDTFEGDSSLVDKYPEKLKEVKAPKAAEPEPEKKSGSK